MSAPASAHPREHPHPGAREYIKIAVALTIITAIEVTVYYLEAMRPILAGVLIVLSAVKFALVVMFYMHLKFDHRLFSGVFLFGLGTAAFTIIAFIALFHGIIHF